MQSKRLVDGPDAKQLSMATFFRRARPSLLPSLTRRALCRDAPSTPGLGAPGGSPLGAVSSADEISTLKLYRDCLKLTYHIAAGSAKGDAMRSMIRSQFKANMLVEDEKEIARLKMLAVVGLQNYVIHEQTGKALEKRRRSGAKPPPDK